LNSLKESEASAELHRLTLEDADKGRMSKPCDASGADLDNVCCAFASMHHVIALCFSAGALWYLGSVSCKALVPMAYQK